MKNIVIIGGGTGTYTLLMGLKKYPAQLSVIVSTADDGGSTGRLRKELGVMPPGDIRQCLLGLSNCEQGVKDLFSYRFESGELKGHNAGNIIIAALEKITGNIDTAIAQASRMLKVKGEIIPVTLKPTFLSAELYNGKIIKGEHYVNEPPFRLPSPDGIIKGGWGIKKIFLSPKSKANPKALKAIGKADAVILGPGDLYSSILPNILPIGMAEALRKSKANKILVTNLMTWHGQTDKFKASDFVRVMKEYLGKKTLTDVVINKQKPPSKWLEAYKTEQSEFIEPDTLNMKGQDLKISTGNLISEVIFKKISGDNLKRSLLRHDSAKLAKLIWSLI